MNITVLMPMGGLGKRFQDKGYTTPKPMIPVDGMPMFLRALESFPSHWEIQNVFVIREDQDERFDLKKLIETACPGARVVVLKHNTRGAVETCLEAESLIDRTSPLIVADCDLRFASQSYIDAIEQERFEGVLVGFDSTDPRYSYAELDNDNMVMRTAEKNPISHHALLGGYYFSSAETFFRLAHEFVNVDLPEGLGEYYLSHLYNLLLSEDASVFFTNVDHFDCWGTPEELLKFQNSARK